MASATATIPMWTGTARLRSEIAAGTEPSKSGYGRGRRGGFCRPESGASTNQNPPLPVQELERFLMVSMMCSSPGQPGASGKRATRRSSFGSGLRRRHEFKRSFTKSYAGEGAIALLDNGLHGTTTEIWVFIAGLNATTSLPDTGGSLFSGSGRMSPWSRTSAGR